MESCEEGGRWLAAICERSSAWRGRAERMGAPSDLLARIVALRDRAARERTGLHYVEGLRGVLQLLDAGRSVETIVYSEILCRVAGAQKRVRLARRAGLPVARVTPEEFRSVSTTPRASGLAAIARQHWTPLERLDPRRGLCWIAIRFLRSRGNFGTLLRTAEAVGAGGVVCLGGAADPFDPSVVRASMGGVFRLEFARASLGAFAAWTREHGCRVVATTPSATVAYTDVPVEPPLVILFGEERAGLTAEELRSARTRRGSRSRAARTRSTWAWRRA
jgi:TrmH family RNA methyltransferase